MFRTKNPPPLTPKKLAHLNGSKGTSPSHRNTSNGTSPSHRHTPSISDAIGVFLKASNSMVSIDEYLVEETGEFYVSDSEDEQKFIFRDDLEY